MQINAYQEGTKNKHWNERVSTEEYWFVLEYMAPLILTSTNLRQPSPNSKLNDSRIPIQNQVTFLSSHFTL